MEYKKYMIKRIFQNTGYLFILYVSVSYVYALFIVYNPELGNNIYNLVEEYSETVEELMPMYIIMIISFYIGWKITFRRVKCPIKINYQRVRTQSTYSISSITSFIMLAICIFLLFTVYGEEMLYRDTYHPKDFNYSFLAVYKILTLFLIVLTYLSDKINKLNKFLLLFSIIFISLSMGSRISAIYLLIIFLMYLFKSEKVKFINIFLYFVSIIFLIIFIQYSRGLEENGLIGILKYTNLFEIFEVFNLIMYYISAFSIFVTAATYESYLPLSQMNDFIIMLNPLPGHLAGWYNINKNMTVMPVVPYSSIGTVFTLGHLGTSIFYLFLGMIIGFYDSFIQKEVHNKKYILAILIWSLLVLFIIFHNQYTLRTSIRFIYYVFVIIFISYFYKLLKQKFQKVKKNDF